MLRNVSEGYAQSVVGEQTIYWQRSRNFPNWTAVCWGNRGKGSLMGRSKSICQSMKAWNYRVHLGNCKLVGKAGI